MTNKDITKIYFQGNEIVALYQGSTLIFKKSSGGNILRGTVTKNSNRDNVPISYNDGQINDKATVNSDNTFEYEVKEPITSTKKMFIGMSYIESLDFDDVDTSKVTDMSNMFNQAICLKSLKLNIDTSKVTDMNRMFYSCGKLESVDLSGFDTSNVTLFEGMFNGCQNLTSLDISNFDTSKLIGLSSMFNGCNRLSDLYLNFYISNITYSLGSFPYTFSYCFSLKNVVGKFEGTKYNLNLSDCPLNAASAMVFIDGLATVTEKRTLALSRTTYDSLTKEQIAIATSKGWTVTRG